MLPHEAKLPVADRATLGRAVTKMLGVVEHLCLLSALPWSCPLPARTCRGVSRCRRSASPIDGDITRMKRPPQSYAGKRSLSKRDRAIYTEVYDAVCRRLRRSARDAKRLRAHSGQPWTQTKRVRNATHCGGFVRGKSGEIGLVASQASGRKAAGSAFERIRFYLATFQLN